MSGPGQLQAARHSEDGDETAPTMEQLTVEDSLQPFELKGFNLITVMSGLALAIFLMSLDSSIVATAVPYITSEFQSAGDTAWYGSAYTLSICALQPIAGKLFTKFSMKVRTQEALCHLMLTTIDHVSLIHGRV